MVSVISKFPWLSTVPNDNEFMLAVVDCLHKRLNQRMLKTKFKMMILPQYPPVVLAIIIQIQTK